VGRRTIFSTLPLGRQRFIYLGLRPTPVGSYDVRMPSVDPAGSSSGEPAARGVPAFAAPSSITSVVTDDGVSLSVRKSGSATSPVIVFVHGFPDDAHVWSGITAALAGEARLVTYDVRGAGSSGAPADREAYRIDRLAADLREVVDAVSPDQRVHLVGHDWGSIQAFHALRTTLAARVTSYTSISGPDLDHIRQWQRRQLRAGPAGWWRLAKQSISSAYIGAFLLRGPVDLATRLGIVGRLVTRDPSRLGARVSRADVRHGLNLYRANLLGRSAAPTAAYPPLDVPVQVIVPSADRYVSRALQTELQEWVRDLSVVTMDGGHWLMLSHPTELADRIRVFVTDTEKRS
jgi:pimeloyl-ACP methyl ester carboxylesterase